MKLLGKASLVLAAFCALSACAKESSRPIEAGNPNNNNGNTATVVTKTNIKCETTVTSTLKVGDGTEKRELKQTDERETKKTTKDKDVNSVFDTTARIFQNEKKINSDGSKTDVEAFAYSFERITNRNVKKIKGNTYLETEIMKGLKTAGEGYFFKVNGEQIKTVKIDTKWETEFFFDGKTEKIISVKQDGNLIPPAEGKYKSEQKVEGDVTVETETLEEPYTPSETPNERIDTSVKLCRYKTLK